MPAARQRIKRRADAVQPIVEIRRNAHRHPGRGEFCHAAGGIVEQPPMPRPSEMLPQVREYLLSARGLLEHVVDDAARGARPRDFDWCGHDIECDQARLVAKCAAKSARYLGFGKLNALPAASQGVCRRDAGLGPDERPHGVEQDRAERMLNAK